MNQDSTTFINSSQLSSIVGDNQQHTSNSTSKKVKPILNIEKATVISHHNHHHRDGQQTAVVNNGGQRAGSSCAANQQLSARLLKDKTTRGEG